MASLTDMTVVIDTSQLDQVVKVQCLARCEYQRENACQLKRIIIGKAGNCLNFEPWSNKIATAIKRDMEERRTDIDAIKDKIEALKT